MAYKTIKKCRLCESERLSKLFSLGNLSISTFVYKKDDNIGKTPLELVWCKKCTLVQLRHTPSQELLYSGNYWYESGLNQVIVEDLKDIVDKGMKLSSSGGTWIDIGANDGTLLSFVPKSYYRIGIEPANNLRKKLAKNCDSAIYQFWEETSLSLKASVITAIGMFYDAEDPNIFIRNVAGHLDSDGIFIAQMMTAKSMLEKNDVGNICHEHLEYYSYRSLKTLFEKNGLEIFKVEENTINGGSYRLYARHYHNGSISYRERITINDYAAFFDRIKKNKKDCIRFIKSQVKKGKKIYGYGASTKGNTILQWYGLGPKDIRGIAEIHPEKLGKLTVGTNIPIVAEEDARKDADFFLVLPYAFKQFFINEREWSKYRDGFIFATPFFEVINGKQKVG